MPDPTDDELLAALLDVLPGETWYTDPDLNAAGTLRSAVEAPTREAMLWSLKVELVGDGDESRVRLADELCRRFPQPITDAVLGECGFEPFARDWALDLSRAAVFAKVRSVGVYVSWIVSNDDLSHGETVTDARRLRELVAGLRVVYGTREGWTT